MSDNMDVRWRFDQTFGRDTQGSVQISDHSQSQRPGVIENFVDSVDRSLAQDPSESTPSDPQQF